MVTGSVNFNHLPNPVSDSFSVSFADSMQRKISYATRRDPVAHLSPHSHLLVCRNSQQISIWRLRSTSSDPDSLLSVVQKKSPNPQDGDAAWAKVVEMDLKVRACLHSPGFFTNLANLTAPFLLQVSHQLDHFSHFS
jgi:hypothetical protein